MTINSNNNLFNGAEEIKTLLTAYFDGEMSNDERHELAVWLVASRTNREMFMRLKNKTALYNHWKRSQSIDTEKEYSLLKQRLYSRTRKKVIIRRVLQLTASAAAVLLLYIGLVEFGVKTPAEENPIAEVVVKNESETVIFHSADGEVIEVDEKMDVSKLVAEKKRGTVKEVQYNEVIVPQGLESKFTLSDGTIVHMNSGSKLRFPVEFEKGSRKVEFEGEVYFKVTSDSLRPFRVVSGDFSVQVLGTTFIARADEDRYSATLAEGSVNLTYRKESIKLIPGKRGSLVDGQLRESDANLEKEFDWVNGCYIFEDETLETIVAKLTTFYQVEFIFVNDDVRDYRFTGKITRDKSLDEAIASLEIMNVIKFHKKDSIISITKNR